MANWASKYAAFIFSIADYAGGVGFSSVMADFPFSPGPDVFYDHWTGYRTIGRNPATGLPLVVSECDRYTRTVAVHGVAGAYDGISPPFGIEPDVCSVTIETTNAAVLGDIDGAAKHLVYGVWNCQAGAEPDDLPPALAAYYVESEMPGDTWTAIRDGLIARGADQQQVDGWRSKHPDATPADVHDAFAQFVTVVLEKLRGT